MKQNSSGVNEKNKNEQVMTELHQLVYSRVCAAIGAKELHRPHTPKTFITNHNAPIENIYNQ